ncbi:MAG: right-handed parallel beta-helix repeat-containing protein [Ignavibacteriales bacterium]|nr:MAG: right-handed parallel beta-helix repeat-containing protein [Ignavibacteriales bacterium]
MKPNKFLLLFLSLYIVNCTLYITHAEVRYVSKTGSSTPPYTSWETAADSIQKAIDVSWIDDTIIVANGIYVEQITVNTSISLIGMSMDSTIIDGMNAVPYYVVHFPVDGSIENFNVIGNNSAAVIGIGTFNANIVIKNCRISNIEYGIDITLSTSLVENCIIKNCSEVNIRDECGNDSCQSVYKNNILLSKNASIAMYFSFGGYPTFTNNIVIEEGTTTWTGVDTYTKGLTLTNNIISGYRHTGMDLSSMPGGSQQAINNIVTNIIDNGFDGGAIMTGTGSQSTIQNNILTNSTTGIHRYNSTHVRSDYNQFWQVEELMRGQTFLGDSNIVADPMFVNDTIPNSQLDFDYHLQKYSPAIDKGNPNILDVDGSRSDIGIFGGPLGQKYTYMDLAPKPPRNLTASLDSGLVHLKWNKNTEADLFRYRVYRDTVPDFIYDPTKLIAVVADTFYYDDVPDRINSGNYYYKLTAIDTAVNQSAASEEVHVTITGIPEAPPVVVEHFRLLQNYPNPFNPSTTIPYRLKEGGYVKVMVYDIKGELVRVLVNQYQSAGYYEVEFSPNKTERKKAEGYVEFETGYYGNVASGIYLYRIEVIGEGQIPTFSDMKKMILLK